VKRKRLQVSELEMLGIFWICDPTFENRQGLAERVGKWNRFQSTRGLQGSNLPGFRNPAARVRGRAILVD
jgi:hypothetical protein